MANRFGPAFDCRNKPTAEILPTGISEIDKVLEGFPRGGVTEIHGAASSGRTSVLLSALALATSREETCALVDCSDTFDPSAAVKGGTDLSRLLWVRCNHNLEHAFKAVDLLLHGGGFGFIALNLCDVPARIARRIISSWWFRFRRALENTPTVLMVITPMACVRSCATLVLELKNEGAVWPSTLSIVSEKRDGKFTERDEAAAPRLSLVATPPPRLLYKSQPPHSHFIEQLHITINQERPVQWLGGATKFKIYGH